MKNQILTAFFSLIITVSVFGQDYAAPKKGAKIYVESSIVEVTENKETTFDLYIVKSKVARKASFENPKFTAPAGLEFSIEQDENDLSHYTVSVKATEIKSGDYSVTVSGKRSGIHTVTGTIMSFKVKPANTLVSKDGE